VTDRSIQTVKIMLKQSQQTLYMPVWIISNPIVRSTKKRLTAIMCYWVNSGTRRNTEVFRARI